MLKIAVNQNSNEADDGIVGTQGVPADNSDYRATQDLLYIYNQTYFINEKGYLQKLVELLYEMGYYKNNKSLFLK